MSKKIATFLSVGEPHNSAQLDYLEKLVTYLSRRNIAAQTLGRTFWSIMNPLKPVREKMQEVYGVVVLAMERFHSKGGIYKECSPLERKVGDQYFATPWTQIEAAMAYQLRLPILILKDEKLVAEGMFDPGIHEWMIVRINPNNPDGITRLPVKAFIDDWIEAVRANYYSRI
jgi:hypothetical protein